METIEVNRLKIRSYSDELLEEKNRYFEKYQKMNLNPIQESDIEKELREEIEYLKRFLNK